MPPIGSGSASAPKKSRQEIQAEKRAKAERKAKERQERENRKRGRVDTAPDDSRLEDERIKRRRLPGTKTVTTTPSKLPKPMKTTVAKKCQPDPDDEISEEEIIVLDSEPNVSATEKTAKAPREPPVAKAAKTSRIPSPTMRSRTLKDPPLATTPIVAKSTPASKFKTESSAAHAKAMASTALADPPEEKAPMKVAKSESISPSSISTSGRRREDPTPSTTESLKASGVNVPRKDAFVAVLDPPVAPVGYATPLQPDTTKIGIPVGSKTAVARKSVISKFPRKGRMVAKDRYLSNIKTPPRPGTDTKPAAASAAPSTTSKKTKPAFGSPVPVKGPSFVSKNTEALAASFTSSFPSSADPPSQNSSSKTSLEPRRRLSGFTAGGTGSFNTGIKSSAGTIERPPRFPTVPTIGTPSIPAVVQEPSRTPIEPPESDRSNLLQHSKDLEDDEEDHGQALREEVFEKMGERWLGEQKHRTKLEVDGVKEQEKQLSPARKSWTSFFYPVVAAFLIVVVAAVGFTQTFAEGLSMFSTGNTSFVDLMEFLWKPSHHSVVCFEDSPGRPANLDPAVKLEPRIACEQGGTKNVGGKSMSLNVEWRVCPEGATCWGGKLVGCPRFYELFTPDVDQSSVDSVPSCVLSEETNETANAMVQLLHDWTVHDWCSGEPHDAKRQTTNGEGDEGWSRRPFFHYSRIVGELECGYDLKFIEATNTSRGSGLFVLERENSNIWLGLHPHVPLSLPWVCQGQHLFALVLHIIVLGVSAMATIAWNMICQVTTHYWTTLLEAPVRVGGISATAVFLVMIIYRRWDDSRTRRQKALDIVRLRTTALQYLEENQDRSFSVERLCQTLAWSMHEDSRAQRHRLINNLWPYVVKDVRQDGRVQRSFRSGGVEFWQWSAEDNNIIPQRQVQFAR